MSADAINYTKSPDEDSLLPPLALPDLGELQSQSSRLAIRRYVGQNGPINHSAFVLQINAVRLADTAVENFKFARTSIEAFHNCQNIGTRFIIQASGHFESCIWALENLSSMHELFGHRNSCLLICEA